MISSGDIPKKQHTSSTSFPDTSTSTLGVSYFRDEEVLSDYAIHCVRVITTRCGSRLCDIRKANVNCLTFIPHFYDNLNVFGEDRSNLNKPLDKETNVTFLSGVSVWDNDRGTRHS